MCQELLINCEYNCGIILKKYELVNHCTNECVNRIITCEHCGEEEVYKEMNQHLDICWEFIVSCPWRCGANITRGQIEDHIDIL